MLETSQSLDISHWIRSFTENQNNESQVLPVVGCEVEVPTMLHPSDHVPHISDFFFQPIICTSFRKLYFEGSYVFVGSALLQDSIVTIIKSEAEDIVIFSIPKWREIDELVVMKFVVILKVKSSLLHN